MNLVNYFEKYENFIPKIVNTDIRKKLNIYFEILLEEATVNGFIAKADTETLWLRHILDSILVLKTPIQFKGKILDMGTGAGLPGIVLAICLPKAQFTLADSSLRKVEFLTQIQQKLSLNNIIPLEIDLFKVSQKKYDSIIFRAFKKPLLSAEVALYHLKHKGNIVYWRGKSILEKNSLQYDKIIQHIINLGYSTQYISVESPDKLGNRGFEFWKYEHFNKKTYPRKFSRIQKDLFLKEVL